MDQFPGCSDNLRQRLASAMVTRRKRILYRRSRYTRKHPIPPLKMHELVVIDHLPPPKSVASQHTSHRIGQAQDAPASSIEEQTESLSAVYSRAKTAKLDDTTTTLDPEILNRKVAPSVLSKAKKSPLGSHEELIFPPPSRASILELFRECKKQRRLEHEKRLERKLASIPGYSLFSESEFDFRNRSDVQGLIQQSKAELRRMIY
jgi:hypothetical protein